MVLIGQLHTQYKRYNYMNSGLLEYNNTRLDWLSNMKTLRRNKLYMKTTLFEQLVHFPGQVHQTPHYLPFP